MIVLICGKLPTKITGDIREEYGFLRSIASHLGLSCDSREDVDRIAAMAKEDGCLGSARCTTSVDRRLHLHRHRPRRQQPRVLGRAVLGPAAQALNAADHGRRSRRSTTERRIILGGAIAIEAVRIVAVGTTCELRRPPTAPTSSMRQAASSPWASTAHQHIPAIRWRAAACPDDLPPGESIFTWAVPTQRCPPP